MIRARLVADLAWRDCAHEIRLFLCSAIGCAAVLAPLIVLLALKHGVVEGLREALIENPRARMLVNTANRGFDAAFLASLAARPDIAFVVPRTRTLNAEARFERPDRPGTALRAELLATAPGDPLLAGQAAPGPGGMVASASLAARLDLAPGMTVTLRAVRGVGASREVLELPLAVAALAPPAAFDRDGAFVALPVLALVDDFTDGLAPPDARPAPGLTQDRVFAGFRAHAHRLEDVVAVDHALRRAGVEVDTRAGEIAGLLRLDRDLDLLFAVIAGLGGVGYLLSLAVGLYAQVERKRRDFALMRLIGLTGGELRLFPALQAAALALAGSALAIALALAVTRIVNIVAADAAAPGARPVCLVAPAHLAMAVAATLLGAVLAAAFAGGRAARIAPAEGLRDG